MEIRLDAITWEFLKKKKVSSNIWMLNKKVGGLNKQGSNSNPFPFSDFYEFRFIQKFDIQS